MPRICLVESSVLDRYRKTAREADVDLRRKMHTNFTSLHLTDDQEKELFEDVSSLLTKFYTMSENNEKELNSRSDLSQTYIRVEVFPIIQPPPVTG